MVDAKSIAAHLGDVDLILELMGPVVQPPELVDVLLIFPCDLGLRSFALKNGRKIKLFRIPRLRSEKS